LSDPDRTDVIAWQGHGPSQVAMADRRFVGAGGNAGRDVAAWSKLNHASGGEEYRQPAAAEIAVRESATQTSPATMPSINPERLLGDLYALRQIGSYKTGVHRPTLSAADVISRQWLVERMTEANLDARIGFQP
jgi:hypothetical protein